MGYIMKVKFLFKQVYVWFLTLLVCVTCFLSTRTIRVYAASAGDFAHTNIEDDLKSIGHDNYKDYTVYNPGETHRVIAVSEYCYSDIPDMSKHYGLYIYIYNVEPIAINTKKNNNVNMAVEFSKDGQPIYENWALEFCDRSDGSVIGFPDYKYYKFRIADSAKLYEKVSEYAGPNHEYKRRYDIAGVQLHYPEGEAIIDEGYSKTLYFSGYAKGCDSTNPKGESTLTYSCVNLDTVKLDVTATNWRDKNDPRFIRDDLQTVFFTVPNSYFQQYGTLQKIKAEWYEYKTKHIFVSSDPDTYNVETGKSVFDDYIGKDIGKGVSKDDLRWTVVWHEYGKHGEYDKLSELLFDSRTRYYGFAYNRDASNGKNVNWEWFKNFSVLERTAHDWSDANAVGEMHYFFYRADSDNRDDLRISGEELEDYMVRYTEKNGGPVVSGGVKDYSEVLFTDSIDDERLKYLTNPDDKKGHVEMTIDAEYQQNILLAKKGNWLDKLLNRPDYDGEELKSIVTLTKDNIGAESDFEQSFYLTNKQIVNKDGTTSTIYSKAKAALDNNQTPILFRFAVTDYYSATARFEEIGVDGMSSHDGYVAQETVFLGFDIISLEFRSETGDRYVVGAVSNPIDIINDIDPQGEGDFGFDWGKIFKTLLVILLLFLLVVVLITLFPAFLPFVLKALTSLISMFFHALLWVITLPFKLFKKKDKEDEKEEK